MKRILIATAATAALALAAPAFAQVGGVVGGTVQGSTGQVTGAVGAQTDATVDTARTTDQVGEAADGAREQVQAMTPAPQVNGAVDQSAAVAVPGATVSEDATASASATAPDVDGALDTADAAADSAVAAAPSATASASASAQVAASAELPDEVNAAIADGSYTTEDLNRAQLAALQ